MVLVRRIQKRGANIVVEAHGEVEFLPGGDVSRWLNRFSNRVTAFAAKEAPANSRPRWRHYGKPLKQTFTTSTVPRTVLLKGGNVMRVYSAVGSTAPYAYYVDQGTGIHNGGSPWEAKVLPPYREFSPSLYEPTWNPRYYDPVARTFVSRRRSWVQINGQEGQHFFDKALVRAFRYMRVYGSGGVVANMSAILATMPTGMENFAGNTPANSAFKTSLREWRRWRDDAYLHRGGLIGTDDAKAKFSDHRERKRAWQKEIRAEQRRQRSEQRKIAYNEREAARSRENRRKTKELKETQTAKPDTKSKTESGMLTRAQDRARVLAKAYKDYGRENVETSSLERNGDRWTLVVRVFTKREGDGKIRPEYKSVSLKAKSR